MYLTMVQVAPEDGKASEGEVYPLTSWASSPAVRRAMQGNRSRDTKPELAVRRLVHSRGLRYRVCVRPLPLVRRTADLVFFRARVAVFIDGCYWHGCPLHHRLAKANADYWSAKVLGNATRDQETTKILESEGWTVLRFWEHEEPVAVAARIEEIVLGGCAFGVGGSDTLDEPTR